MIDDIPPNPLAQRIGPADPVAAPRAEKSSKWVSEALDRVAAGHGRNDAGFWLAQQLRDDRLSSDEAAWYMREFVDHVQTGDHPYTEAEALASLRSAYRREARPPAGVDDDPLPRPRRVLARPWPSLPEEAMHGLAGDAVNLILPHSEADPAAILIQFLVMYGNAIGRSAHWKAEADEHYGNLFAMLVGRTARGRKGTSLGQVKRLFAAADPEWLENRTSGLSTGEGLIHAVRDPSTALKQIRDGNRMLTGEFEEVPDDPGVSDKRLLVVETEFARVLKVMSRDGNTLSVIIREAWDSGHLRVMTKTAPLKATDAHISIIGHITVEELKKCLNSTDAANGFANRFLWVCTDRSKSLPEGGSPLEADVARIRTHVANAIRFGSAQTLVVRDAEARRRWHTVYEQLSEGRTGLLGFVTTRAEAQVMRLAMLYALSDCSSVIRLSDLDAAIALWSYIVDSARYIFGDSVGDKHADQILKALRVAGASGMSRTAIMTNVFGKNVKSEAIDEALTLLHDMELAFPVTEMTGGRPADVWRSLG